MNDTSENELHPIAKFLRLQNGDDVVAELVEFEDEHGIMYMLVNPLKVVYMQSQHTGYLQIAFMPWVFPKMVEHQEFMIHADDVMLISDLSQKMNIYYWENLDTMQGKVDPEPQQESIPEEEESLAEVLRELNNKRTYH